MNARVWRHCLGLGLLASSGCVVPAPAARPANGGTIEGPSVQKAEAPSPGPPIPAVGGGTFRLAWEDDFDRLDRRRWRLMTHSFPTNLARFSTENVRIENGTAVISLTENKADSEKPFRGVEMRSVQAFTYGRVEARARFAKGSGVVSSLVTIYTPWPADDWNELDFECLGAFPDRIQTNAMVYIGPPVARPAREAVSPTPDAEMINLAFDPTADFHVYTLEWTPRGARYLVDGKLVREWTTEIERMKLPQNILLTIWASEAEGWAGPLESPAPTSAVFDWVRAYTWQP